jgi:hypothetical protein
MHGPFFLSGVRNNTLDPLKRNPENMPHEPPSLFGTMFYTPKNRLKVAFRAQSQIGWENFVKGRLSRDCTTCMDYQFQMNGSKLTGQECIAKLKCGCIATTDIMKIPRFAIQN